MEISPPLRRGKTSMPVTLHHSLIVFEVELTKSEIQHQSCKISCRHRLAGCKISKGMCYGKTYWSTEVTIGAYMTYLTNKDLQIIGKHCVFKKMHCPIPETKNDLHPIIIRRIEKLYLKQIKGNKRFTRVLYLYPFQFRTYTMANIYINAWFLNWIRNPLLPRLRHLWAWAPSNPFLEKI